MIDYQEDVLEFRIGAHILSFTPARVNFETFNLVGNYYGIIFIEKTGRYEIIYSKMGTRLLLNSSNGESRDLPFHSGTWHFLPDTVKVRSK